MDFLYSSILVTGMWYFVGRTLHPPCGCSTNARVWV